jgi:hypothetical protein
MDIPRWASSNAMLRPMPLLAPVINAYFINFGNKKGQLYAGLR